MESTPKLFIIEYWFENNDTADYNIIEIEDTNKFDAIVKAEKEIPFGKLFKVVDIQETRVLKKNK